MAKVNWSQLRRTPHYYTDWDQAKADSRRSKGPLHKETSMTRNEYIGHPEPHNDKEREHLAYLTEKLGPEKVAANQKQILVQFRLWAPLMDLPRVDMTKLTPREKEVLGTAARLEGKEYADSNAALILAQAGVLGHLNDE
jgi:hypothetical protein